MADPDAPVLSPYYYRENFLRLCAAVEAQYADILTTGEHALLASFRGLEFKAQCLYVRLVSRTGPWFRESKLVYAELGPVAPILDALLAAGLAMEAATLSAAELGQLFTRSELQRIFPRLDHGQLRDKAALLEAIGQLPPRHLQALGAIDGQRIVAPRGTELVQFLQLLFFGNRRQGLTDFVLQELGVTRYYPYPLDRAHRLFPCRQACEEYLACAALRDRHYELLDAGEPDMLPLLAAQVLATDIRFAASEQHRDRLCNNLARDLERLGEWELALQLYGRSQRHPARERRARILETGGDWAGAAALCEEILRAPWCEAEREAAERIVPRLRRQLDGTRLPRRRDAFSTVTLQLPAGDGGVERQVANHLQGEWQAVHYVENKLMNTLFGLAFWEQIFAAVPGVFHNPYQSAPADMHDSAFYSRRRHSIDTRLEQLRTRDLAQVLVDAYHRYHDYQSRWVDWRRIDASLVEASARAIPRPHLLAIWERMLFDPGENRRGFPDLIALGAAPGEYCLIEVKGPGDALQDSQKRWLRYFQAQQIPAQVARVEWDDA
ncbi:MAG: VRR-NUC domain-containing protein [Halioglobus sp.]